MVLKNEGEIMKCPDCGAKLKEENESPLKIKQKIVKLSQERLGIYFSKNVIRSLNLQKAQEIFLSVPDKKHIVLELEHE